MEPHEFAAAFEKLNQMVREKALSATVPVFAARSKSEELWPFGTGTLAAIGNRRLLVTAAHVRTKQKKQGYDFLCAATAKGSFTALIQGNWILYPKVDVAIFELSERHFSDLEANAFVSLCDIALDVETSTGIFALFGLPAVWSAPSLRGDSSPVKSKALQFITHAYSGSTTGLENFDASVHVVLNAGSADHRNDKGEEISWPDRLNRFLPGISGCGIWKLCREGELPALPDPAHSRLVAVETGVFSDRGIVKGTKWSVVAALIQESFPDLKPTFDIIWPQSPHL